MSEKLILEKETVSVSDAGTNSVIAEKKPYINHTKILVCRKGLYNEELKQARLKCLRILHCFEHNHKLSFVVSRKNGNIFTKEQTFSLVYKNGKFNFYYTRNIIVKCGNTYIYLLQDLFRYHIKKQFKINKTAVNRLYQVIKRFCKKHNVSLRYKPKDPFNLMTDLCYPFLYLYTKKYECRFSGLFKKDLTKQILGTNGSKSRQLLINTLSKNPSNISNLFLIRQIRIKYGLDYTQEFINKNLSDHWITMSYYQANAHISAFKTLINTISKDSLLISNQNDLRDTISQIHDYVLSGLVEMPNYNNLKQLHQELTNRINRYYGNIKNQTLEDRKNTVLDAYSKKIQDLINKWSHHYKLVVPEKGEVLYNWSNEMHNCVSSYLDQIKAGRYLLFGIVGDRLLYNIGFKVNNNFKLRFEQWSGKYNSRIPEDDAESLKKEFKRIGINI